MPKQTSYPEKITPPMLSRRSKITESTLSACRSVKAALTSLAAFLLKTISLMYPTLLLSSVLHNLGSIRYVNLRTLKD